MSQHLLMNQSSGFVSPLLSHLYSPSNSGDKMTDISNRRALLFFNNKKEKFFFLEKVNRSISFSLVLSCASGKPQECSLGELKSSYLNGICSCVPPIQRTNPSHHSLAGINNSAANSHSAGYHFTQCRIPHLPPVSELQLLQGTVKIY